MTITKDDADQAAYEAEHGREVDWICPCGQEFTTITYDDEPVFGAECPDCGSEAVPA